MPYALEVEPIRALQPPKPCAGEQRLRTKVNTDKGHIWGVYVTARFRGTGVGRRMLQVLLEQAARLEGIKQIVLAVATTQVAAIALYQSLGFRSFGHEHQALKIGDRYVDEEHMVLYFAGGALLI
jgi:ribosomal protein S18 acetylase RimI-like enzyme